MTAAVHPGEILREKLEEMGVSGSEAADRLNVSQPYMSALLNGRTGAGPKTALKLERLTGISAEMWVGLQARYDLAVARQTAQAFAVSGDSEPEPTHDITP